MACGSDRGHHVRMGFEDQRIHFQVDALGVGEFVGD
jgi:hypothetical protein